MKNQLSSVLFDNWFFCVQLISGITHSVWGDPRNNILNIWYARHNTDGTILSMDEVIKEPYPKVILYPNPAKDFARINFGNITDIKVYDSFGKLLQEHKVSENKNSFQINIHNLPSWIYYLVCDSPTGFMTKKLIRE